MLKPFESLELLPDDPPFGAELIRGLGLRGLHCGSNDLLQRGWLNTDLMHGEDVNGNQAQQDRIAVVEKELYYLEHDAREPFPIEDQTFEWVYSEHFIEHITPGEAVAWLKEAHRLLKPNGLLRLSTPDLRKYMTAYLERDSDFFPEHRRRIAGVLAMFLDPEQRSLNAHREHVARNFFVGEPEDLARRAWMVNQIFYLHGHHWIYDFDELRYVLALAGFDADLAVECSCRQGRVPEVYKHDRPEHDDESVYVEVIRT